VDLWAAITEEVGTNGGEQERRQRRGFQSRSVRQAVVRALAAATAIRQARKWGKHGVESLIEVCSAPPKILG